MTSSITSSLTFMPEPISVLSAIQYGSPVREIGVLNLTSGRVVVADAFECIHFFPLDLDLTPGNYTVWSLDKEGETNAAILDCERGDVESWAVGRNQWNGPALVGVDSGAAAFVDYSSDVFWTPEHDLKGPVALVGRRFSAVTFRCINGPGAYRIWYGLNAIGSVSKVVVDCST